MDTSWNRKNQHIHYAEMQYQSRASNGLDEVRFVHHSLSPMTTQDVTLATELGSLSLDYPFFINAMTGGSDKAYHINKNLAEVANTTGLAMAVGSVSAAMKDSSVEDSFKIVREMNPKGLIFSNLGAHHSLENAKRSVDLLEANALQLHLNTPQELVMPEGDRDFTSWLHNIETIVSQLSVPVIVKEVGFGMSKETIQQLINVGVTIIDISGRGGTNFIHIENERRDYKEYDYLLDWGQTTAESLLEAYSFSKEVSIISSGGIRHPLDMLKSYGLGASAVGISGEFLHMILTKGNEETIRMINSWKQELQHLLTMVQATSIKEVSRADMILSSELSNWCTQRQLIFK